MRWWRRAARRKKMVMQLIDLISAQDIYESDVALIREIEREFGIKQEDYGPELFSLIKFDIPGSPEGK